MQNYRLTVILPVYNEEAALDDVLKGIKAVFADEEIIVVNDGSTDRSSEIASKAGVKVIHHPRSMGYGAALKTGIRHASGELVAFMDGDGQHDPIDLQKLTSEMENNEMVIGARGKSSHVDFNRRFGKWLLKHVANFLAEQKIPDLNSGLRVVRKEVIMRIIHLLPNGFSFSTTSTVALMKLGYRLKYIPITVSKRQGKSTVKIAQDGLNTVLLILRLIALFNPMKVFLPVSLFLVEIGALYQIVLFFLRGFHIVGGAILCILTGVFIFFIGILADQISSMRLENIRE